MITKEKFWTAIGFRWIGKREFVHGYLMHGGNYVDGHWLSPTDEKYWELPELSDLSALFKWAVPKIKRILSDLMFYPEGDKWVAVITAIDDEEYRAIGKEPAEALASAIWKALGVEE